MTGWTDDYPTLQWLYALGESDTRPRKPRAGRVMAVASVLAFYGLLDSDGVGGDALTMERTVDTAGLARVLGITERSARACLAWLVDAGWLEVITEIPIIIGAPTAYRLTFPEGADVGARP